MKNKMLVLEHGNKMFYSKEIIQLHVPKEINLMLYSILALMFCVMILVFFCQINDVIKVSGCVRTETNNSTVRNVIAGKIDELYYRPEQFVEKGDLLYSINPEVQKSLEQELRLRLQNCEEQLECMNALLDGIAGIDEASAGSWDGKTGSFERSDGFRGSKQKNAGIRGGELVQTKLDEYFGNLAYFEKQVEILEYRLLKERNQPGAFYSRQNVDEATMNYELCLAELEKYKAGFLAEIVQKKKAYELQRDEILQELVRNLEQAEYLDVKAPVSGFVQEVALLNKGDYVSAEQTVLVIVPDDSRNFRVEMSIPTRDIGEIVPGMAVKYRLSAFPFFEYKGAEGKILSVDSDIRNDGNGGLHYRVYSDIDRTVFTSRRGNSYSIKAGIDVDARIVKERISVLHFILRKLDFVQ